MPDQTPGRPDQGGYDFARIESKWQRRWDEDQPYRTATYSDKPPYYALEFFPYPSGDGLSVGHFRNYIPVDAFARYKRMRGFEVLHPMGWDAFGLPAEQDAIDKGRHPAESIIEYAANYRRQLKLVGCGYDWDREINSSHPDYYRWTQWIFLQLFRRGLAYRAEKRQWWCDTCGALADEEVLADGKCWRGHSNVYRKPLRQWFFRIRAYADRLLEDLDQVDWPESTKRMQVNWIGRSTGADVIFETEAGHQLSVYTTRPDTLYGATFMVLAPEHPLLEELTAPAQSQAVGEYVDRALRTSEIERATAEREKTGVFTGSFAINPVNDEKIPIWVADYVLASYGSGAIMAVPAHDQRDFDFAERFDLPIPVVIEPPGWDGQPLAEAYVGEGRLINSGSHSGLDSDSAIAAVTADLEARGRGSAAVNYRLRDWLISRQRYWGCPIPIVHCEECGQVPVPEEELPVLLPPLEDFRPDPELGSPLERARDWVATSCPQCGGPARRETDTLGGFACSSWYFLRFITPDFESGPVEPNAEKRWMPVDLYVGGAEHSVMHLLYARFWNKVLYDAGHVSSPEPFKALRHQGMMLAEDGWVNLEQAKLAGGRISARVSEGFDVYSNPSGEERDFLYHAPAKAEFELRGDPVGDWAPIRSGKMSKSLGNVVTPDSVVERYGADSLRGYEMFMAPLEGTLPWSESGLNGITRFYRRLLRLISGEPEFPERGPQPLDRASGQARRIAHRAIAKCSEDIEQLRFNTMLANGLMEPVNELLAIWSQELADSPAGAEVKDILVRLLAPVAPHLAEELWEMLGNSASVVGASWPEADPALLRSESVTVVVQVNGRVRDRMDAPAGLAEDEALAAALELPNVKVHLDGKAVRKVIYVPERLLNLVVG
ncbi:MAG: leucine--tRNA ligase [Chloroflexi bacterium]|nr:leucine--tRNA ligase [Chloroflexota bacterium]MDE2937115.1 leucine--tRNA ligase [Chloroflexota bacterium]MXW28804.1 leucine--tRNA ligase [Chloroflexota bacterium]MXX67325.1 leucine--tRNA ligase [Chloroflexota bacterium]MXX99644.1 leucine--tRNA ligase [Chloroflexota bacterium]